LLRVFSGLDGFEQQ